MRALWIDEGNDPDWAKVAGMSALYFSLRDPTPDLKRRLQDTVARGFVGGVYGAWNWHQGFLETDGAGFAEWVNKRLVQLVAEGYPIAPNRPKVQLNNERHEPQVILAMLDRWRQLRAKQDTSWTMEGGQGGWMTATFVSRVVAHRIRLAPQLYNGAMDEVWDSLAYSRDLTRRGFPDGLISPFYDAAALPVGWDGFAFTMGRLP